MLTRYQLCFAMGTSALEAANAGRPTILVDSFNEPFEEDYKYRFLYETKGYTLGYADKRQAPTGTYYFSDLIEILFYKIEIIGEN